MELESKRIKLDATEILDSIEFMLPLVNNNEQVLQAMIHLKNVVEENVTLHIEMMPAEVIMEIIKHITPEDLGRFCALSKRFAEFCGPRMALKRLVESKLRGTKNTILLVNLDTQTYAISPPWDAWFNWIYWASYTTQPSSAWTTFGANWIKNPDARVVAYFSPSGREIPYINTWTNDEEKYPEIMSGKTNTGLQVEFHFFDHISEVWLFSEHQKIPVVREIANRNNWTDQEMTANFKQMLYVLYYHSHDVELENYGMEAGDYVAIMETFGIAVSPTNDVSPF